MSTLISVCLPTLNSIKYLEERIASIDKQTLTEFEVVVVDSFSEDGTWQKLNEWAERDPRVRVFQAERGLYQAWNICVSRSRGHWIYFATSDDTMVSTCLEDLFSEGSKAEAELVTSAEWYINDVGTDIPFRRGRLFNLALWERNRGAASLLNGNAESIFALTLSSTTNSITQMLIRRSVFEKVGMFPTNLGSAGDLYWQILAYANCRCLFIPQKVGSWRIHASQATSFDEVVHQRKRLKVLEGIQNAPRFPSGLIFRSALNYALAYAYRSTGAIMEKSVSEKIKYPNLLIASILSRFPSGPRQQIRGVFTLLLVLASRVSRLGRRRQ